MCLKRYKNGRVLFSIGVSYWIVRYIWTFGRTELVGPPCRSGTWNVKNQLAKWAIGHAQILARRWRVDMENCARGATIQFINFYLIRHLMCLFCILQNVDIDGISWMWPKKNRKIVYIWWAQLTNQSMLIDFSFN